MCSFFVCFTFSRINGFFFLLLSNILAYGCTTICLSIQLLMDVWVISSFGLIQIKLL